MVKRVSCSVWSAVQPAGLVWTQWPTDNGIFDPYTGETHLLSELPAYLLRRLCERPRHLDELCADAARACETANDGAWRATIADALTLLEKVELVECLQEG